MEKLKAASNLLAMLTKQASSSSLSKVPAKTVQRTMLAAEDTFTTPLFLIVMDKYGEDALSWSPDTIRRELQDDFQLSVPQFTLDKIMAAITLVTTNYFYKDVGRFIEICNILAGDEFQPDEFEPADAGEILFGMTEAMLLWPPGTGQDSQFSAEIREYISQVLKSEGIVEPFDVLRVAFQDNTPNLVSADFADDPEMYQAIYEMQKSKQSELKTMMLANVEALSRQLYMLPLQNGSTNDVVSQLQNLISQAAVAR